MTSLTRRAVLRGGTILLGAALGAKLFGLELLADAVPSTIPKQIPFVISST